MIMKNPNYKKAKFNEELENEFFYYIVEELENEFVLVSNSKISLYEKFKNSPKEVFYIEFLPKSELTIVK